ncbi:MAG: zf-HC2 domain-containing protein [Acidobacteriota bacterium]|nr:zf-HC2 domain-containing protein [Acidobacteriota bacterium]
MSSQCRNDFDQALLSGYLDDVLTQQDTQRVRLHLETCTTCSHLVEEMKTTREVTMTSTFATPPDDQWDERPSAGLSRLSFGLGWGILIIWFVASVGFALGQLWSGPESLTEKLLIFSALTAVTLLLLSVLIDRLKRLGSDRYRRIEK